LHTTTTEHGLRESHPDEHAELSSDPPTTPTRHGSDRAAHTATLRSDQAVADHRVLVLSGFAARLFEAIGGPLREVHDATFPLPEPPNPPRRANTPTPTMAFTGRHRALLAVAATATQDRARRHPARLVVVGPRRNLRSFAQVAGSLVYLTVRCPRTSLGLDRLVRIVRRRVLS
jgi:hypothetical protein